ncbi:MAG: Hsp20/alpha crystallin family protein [Labilithrix sp.]|nr:Hsp20/alpha crystallin family protein [Labilithrix sp.]
MKNELTKSTNEERSAVRPRVDVYESEREYLVVADLPGVAKEAVEVHFEGGELRLEARRESTAAGTPILEEYRAADYRRAFAMPDGIDAEKIEAQLEKGVLTVSLPKIAAKRPRRIEIRPS